MITLDKLLKELTLSSINEIVAGDLDRGAGGEASWAARAKTSKKGATQKNHTSKTHKNG